MSVQTALMAKYLISCEDDLETVVLHIGSIDIRMDYKTALEMSAALRHSGKKAKLWAGDMSSTILSMAELTDAETDIREEQARRVIV